jgi:uncharacterized phage protein gp47/JayE
MSLQTPTTQETSDLILSQFEASLSQTIPLLPKAFLRVLAKVMAGVFMLLYKYGGFMFLQMFVRTATYDQTTVNGKVIRPLQEWGNLIGEPDREPATKAELTVDVTVTSQGGSLPSGSQVVNSDTGVTYITLAPVLLDAATVSVTVRAASDQSGGNGSGAQGNVDVGTELQFASPLANVSRTVIVTAQTVQGVDAETVDSYRSRIIKRFQRRPQGGALADYEEWGLDAAGIVNIYPYTGEFAGEVDVYAEATEASSGSPDGIPSQAQLDQAEAFINFDEDGLASRRPANAYVNVYPIFRTGFDISVTGLSVDNPANVQGQITAAIEQYFLDRAPYIIGLSTPPRRDRITASALSGVVDDIVSAAGGIFTDVTVEKDGSPLSLYELGIGEKAKANSVGFL